MHRRKFVPGALGPGMAGALALRRAGSGRRPGGAQTTRAVLGRGCHGPRHGGPLPRPPAEHAAHDARRLQRPHPALRQLLGQHGFHEHDDRRASRARSTARGPRRAARPRTTTAFPRPSGRPWRPRAGAVSCWSSPARGRASSPPPFPPAGARPLRARRHLSDPQRGDRRALQRQDRGHRLAAGRRSAARPQAHAGGPIRNPPPAGRRRRPPGCRRSKRRWDPGPRCWWLPPARATTPCWSTGRRTGRSSPVCAPARGPPGRRVTVRGAQASVRFQLLELTPDGKRLQVLQSAVCAAGGFSQPADLAGKLVERLGPLWSGSAIPPAASDPVLARRRGRSARGRHVGRQRRRARRRIVGLGLLPAQALAGGWRHARVPHPVRPLLPRLRPGRGEAVRGRVRAGLHQSGPDRGPAAGNRRTARRYRGGGGFRPRRRRQQHRVRHR